MTELEKAERLREKANVTFAEAKDALDKSDGDLLGAMIYLENEGKVSPPAERAANSADTDGSSKTHNSNSTAPTSAGFGELVKRFLCFLGKLINRGNNNYLDATKNNEPVFSAPVTAVAVLLIFFFWIIVPLFIVSLFFGFRYRFRGEDLGREPVNKVMDSASEAAEDIKKSFGTKKQ